MITSFLTLLSQIVQFSILIDRQMLEGNQIFKLKHLHLRCRFKHTHMMRTLNT
jgi:hypothetical protein